MYRVYIGLFLILVLVGCTSSDMIANTQYTKHTGTILSIVETDNKTKKEMNTSYFLTIDGYTPSFEIYPKYEATYKGASSSRFIGITPKTQIFKKISEDKKVGIGVSDLIVDQHLEIWVAPNKQDDEFLDVIEITILNN